MSMTKGGMESLSETLKARDQQSRPSKIARLLELQKRKYK